MASYAPITLRSGQTLQSAVPKSGPGRPTYQANGLNVRGVVIAVYALDDDGQTGGGQTANPNLDSSALALDAGPPAIYCDVLTYSTLPGAKDRVLQRVLVTSERGGLHNGRIRIPRPARLDLGTRSQVRTDALGTFSKNGNPAQLDGDHVLVGFMDDDLGLPFILCGIPHPSADVGAGLLSGGNRTRIRTGDGEPDYVRHNGVTAGVSGAGDYIVNTRRAHRPVYQDTGELPDIDGNTTATGNVTFELQPGAEFTVTGLPAQFSLRGDGSLALSGSAGDKIMEIRFGRDGAVELSQWPASATNERTTVRLEPNGDVAIDAGRDPTGTTFARNVTIRANNVTVDAGTQAIVNAPSVELATEPRQPNLLGDTLVAALDQLKAQIAAISVTAPSGGGPTSTPLNASAIQAIDFDSAKSTKVNAG